MGNAYTSDIYVKSLNIRRRTGEQKGFKIEMRYVNKVQSTENLATFYIDDKVAFICQLVRAHLMGDISKLGCADGLKFRLQFLPEVCSLKVMIIMVYFRLTWQNSKQLSQTRKLELTTRKSFRNLLGYIVGTNHHNHYF